MVVQAAEGQACGRALLQGFGHREVFEHQQGVEQRALLARPALDVVERHMFVIAQAQVQRLQLAEPARRPIWAGAARLTSGKVLINRPSCCSIPGSGAERPATVAPNATQSWPV